MKQQFQDKLYAKYPKIFAQKDLSMRHTAMCWGIECGDGWYNIIDQLCRGIQHHVDSQRKERAREQRYNRALRYALRGKVEFLENYYKRSFYKEESAKKMVEMDIQNKKFKSLTPYMHQVQFTQVKEKYGTLRVYYMGGDDYITGLVSMAEMMSGRTCETCGVPGRQTEGNWIWTLCFRCAKERGKELISQEEDDEVY